MRLLTHDLHDQVQSGDILFWRGHGAGAAMIKKWTRSEWSHVGVAWVVDGMVLSIEARPFRPVGVVDLLTDSREEKPHWRQMNIQWNKYITQGLLRTTGDSYGWLDDVRVAFKFPPIGRGFQCAELVAFMLKLAGRPYPTSPVPNDFAEPVE